MRKHSSVRVAVMVSAALAMVTGSAIAAGGGPKATGGVKFVTAEGGDGKANFNAQPTSTGAKGTVQVVITGVANVADFKGDVTCYSQVAPNTARFSGPIVKGSALVSQGPDEGQPATGYRITVVDTGSPGAGNDAIRVQRTAGVLDCNTDTDAPRPILTGNIQVHQG